MPEAFHYHYSKPARQERQRLEQFDDFGLAEPLLRAVRQEGYTTPTPIQKKAIPHVMAGRDLMGCAQTGTGKTAAFALPILHRLGSGHAVQANAAPARRRRIRTLVLTPTRELAAQIAESFVTYGRHWHLRSTVVFGGVGQGPQTKALERGVDILVATPGRLLDLIQQGFVHLESVEVFVLDEADRMLDMGFIEDVRRIVSRLPSQRQTLLFSATMPAKVQDLADSILHDCIRVRIAPEAPAADTVKQAVYFVEHGDKRQLLTHVLNDASVTRALIFTRTKHGADKVTRYLRHANIPAEAIHSNKSQTARTRALDDFKSGKTRVLVASDIAARGIDVEDISHVINYDLPQEPEMYVHRIGRTGRAGATGIALTFCDPNERECLDIIESLVRARIPTIAEHPWHSPIPTMRTKEKTAQPARRRPFAAGNRSSRPQRATTGRPHGRHADASPAGQRPRRAHATDSPGHSGTGRPGRPRHGRRRSSNRQNASGQAAS